MPPTTYRLRFSHEAELVVWFLTERGRVVSYAVVVLALHEGEWHPVRVYDNAHGRHEVHRHTLTAGKQPADTFHEGGPAEAMRAARDEVLAGYARMIEAWRR